MRNLQGKGQGLQEDGEDEYDALVEAPGGPSAQPGYRVLFHPSGQPTPPSRMIDRLALLSPLFINTSRALRPLPLCGVRQQRCHRDAAGLRQQAALPSAGLEPPFRLAVSFLVCRRSLASPPVLRSPCALLCVRADGTLVLLHLAVTYLYTLLAEKLGFYEMPDREVSLSVSLLQHSPLPSTTDVPFPSRSLGRPLP